MKNGLIFPSWYMESGFIKTLKTLPESEKLIVDYLAILFYLIKFKGIFVYEGISDSLEGELALMVDSTRERIDRIIRYGNNVVIDRMSNNSIRFNESMLFSCNVSKRSRRFARMENIKDECAKRTKLSTMQNEQNPMAQHSNNLAFDFGSGFEIREKENEREKEKESNKEKERDKAKEKENSLKNVRRQIYDLESFKLAEYFCYKIRQNSPSFRTPNLIKWAIDLCKINRIDGMEYSKIREMIDFAQGHYFWYRNILSPDKLRKQWDRLEIEQNHEVRTIIKIKPNHPVELEEENEGFIRG